MSHLDDTPRDGDRFTHMTLPGREERTCFYRDDVGEWWWERPLTRDYTGDSNPHGPERCDWPHDTRPIGIVEVAPGDMVRVVIGGEPQWRPIMAIDKDFDVAGRLKTWTVTTSAGTHSMYECLRYAKRED